MRFVWKRSVKSNARFENRTRLFAVPTDFDVHSFWFHSDVDAYFVAADHTKTRLASDPGIDREHVHVTGIPVKTEFGSLPSIRNHPDEEGARPLRLLISGGGTGTGPLHAIAEALQEVSAPLNITVVAGHNEKLYRRIRRTTYSRHPVRAYGYVRHMHDLMNECDVLVSKAGGLTTTEAIVSQTPMMIYRPIPGQEARNAAWLVGEKLAVEVRDIRELVRQIEAWQRDPRPLQAMRDRMARIKKPDSTAQICRLIGRYIEN